MWRGSNGGHVEGVLPYCTSFLSSGVRVITSDLGTVVPESQEPVVEDRRKVLDAVRVLNVEKEVGVTFTMANGLVVKKTCCSRRDRCW